MIREKIKEALIQAMKNKDEIKTSTLRLVNATIKDKDIEDRLKGNSNGISDEAILSVLQSMIKQRKDSIAAYIQGKREDLAKKEQAEIDVIMGFLPEQMSNEDTQKVIKEAIGAIGIVSVKEMGKLMGYLKEKYQGKMDFSQASQIIKKLLA